MVDDNMWTHEDPKAYGISPQEEPEAVSKPVPEPPMAVSHPPQEPPMAVSHEQTTRKNWPAPKVEDWKKAKLIEHEGFRLNPYKDTTGNITGGIGHKFTKEDFKNWNPAWSEQEKYDYWMKRFKEDYAIASRAAIKTMIKYDIKPTEKIQYVLTDMIFNMGALNVAGGVAPDGTVKHGFKNFLQDLKKGDIEGATIEMKRKNKSSAEKNKWYKQVPNRVESLVKILRSENESS